MRAFVAILGRGIHNLNPNAGDRLKDQISTNLRQFRIKTGYDYVGFGIRGALLDDAPGLDLARLEQRLRVNHPGMKPEDVRVVVSDKPVSRGEGETAFTLMVNISDGEQFAWEESNEGCYAVVTTRAASAPPEIESTILDVFQDVMIANCPSIQSIINKYVAAGHTADSFFQQKAEFAQEAVRQGGGRLLERFAATRYASFSAIARHNHIAAWEPKEIEALARLWTDFMISRFSRYFLDAQEAADVCRKGYFHGSSNRARHRQHGFLPEQELISLFTDTRYVRSSGSYILCILDRVTPGLKGDVDAAFGVTPAGNPRRFRLCTEAVYREEMSDFVAKGVVTPIRLFLAAPDQGRPS
jgi:hypothetical protein